jgi:hypothetical protein
MQHGYHMTRFTKEEMLNELRTIFLFEADHILMGAGEEMAVRFIGFPPQEDREYCHSPHAQVDLGRFQITRSFDAGYEFAFRPSLLNTIGEHEVQDLSVFMLGTPKAGGGGETDRFMTPDGLCQMVADAVHARWKLEWDRYGQDLSTRELALLADMTEGAVRNALADKSESRLRAVPGSKNPVTVEHAEALRWLSGRRGFIASPSGPGEDRFLREHLQTLQSAEALGRLIGRRLWSTFGTPDKAPAALGWSLEKLDSWQRGTQMFNAEEARKLAEVFDLDVPLFVGKALEVTTRRDAVVSKGGEL